MPPSRSQFWASLWLIVCLGSACITRHAWTILRSSQVLRLPRLQTRRKETCLYRPYRVILLFVCLRDFKQLLLASEADS